MNKQLLKNLIFVLAASMMIAHGARMMYQGVFQPQSYYPAPTPQSLDFYFDWMILCIFGCILLGYTLFTSLKTSRINHKHTL